MKMKEAEELQRVPGRLHGTMTIPRRESAIFAAIPGNGYQE